MKSTVSLLLAIGWAATASGGTLTNEGSAALVKHIEISWSVPTNDWSKQLWTYKVVPQQFSEAVVSNVMALGPFTAQDRTNVHNYVDSKDEVIFFGRLDGKMKYLAICPALGFLEYHDGTAKSSSQLQPVVGVPTQDEATQLGLSYLRQIGIDVSQLSTKPGTGELNLHWERQRIGYVDQKTKADVTLTNGFGVFFLRRVDGIDVEGIGLNGGAYMSFGNNAKPADLQISWRNLKPYRLNGCPSPRHIGDRIKDGQIALHAFGTKSVYDAPIQRLTVTKVSTLYNGKHYDEPMAFVSPFGRFEAVAEYGTNKTSLWFEFPMTLQ